MRAAKGAVRLIDVNATRSQPRSTGAMRTLIAAALLVLVAAQPALARNRAADRGFDFARRNCAMCHAIDREGDSPNPLSPPFRRLHDRYPVENLAEALAEGILVGHPQMPEFRFSPREILDIIAYLKSIQTDVHAKAAHQPLGARAGS